MRLLIILWFLGATDGGALFKRQMMSRTELACCQDEHILSCSPFELDPASLGDPELYLEPLNTTLLFEGMVGDSDHSYHYGNDHVDFIITLQVQNGDAYGYAALDDGRTFTIEFCGDGVHVFKAIDVENLGASEAINDQVGSNNVSVRSWEDLRDTTTIVTYTIKVYYTPQFAAKVSDIDGFIDQVIQLTNQGYINSRVPMRVRVLCSEQATLNDLNDGQTMIERFAAMKGSLAALRGTADAAALLVGNFRLQTNLCGIAYTNSISSGRTVSVTKKSCALESTTFGHELGHNFGLQHNIEQDKNDDYSDGHGYLFGPGYRTIMAYYNKNYRTQVNYYSNPTVRLPINNAPTGKFGSANNARILTANRFAMARLGDESDSSCALSTSCSVQSTWRWMREDRRGKVSAWGCKRQCSRTGQCIAWKRNESNGYCYLINMRTGKRDSRKFSGPDVAKSACFPKTAPCSLRGKEVYQSGKSAGRTSSAAQCMAICQTRGYCHRWNWNGSWCVTWSLKQRSGRFTSGFKYCSG
eukprot:TRINITY_DN1892_c0_g2_i4.p1 TRINITY_DN1892_c0_g2~~TRINITY_DN1892_c0_g2_i4.p1  ORF type:complete len:527 (-),score=57.13 TRINITY_DN1892_c0_g2_i4:73-1653(-)